ncbi:Aste57867_4590 [Aphanomyces stellatus]|uniref:Aste57867_4590 protein n=1 Tax=Aphanomyces stellatus TaxID=120398 RepID=A0A485KGW7_9STRA|nr:hypothetical protein As57867_004577 [Aphanomyces stellatus]VFT81695.1 Aste57867_4590 [Aphanomyces stellatus]
MPGHHASTTAILGADHLLLQHQLIPFTARKVCCLCCRGFNLLRRKHHCLCGEVLCGTCVVPHQANVPIAGTKAVKVCLACVRNLPRHGHHPRGSYQETFVGSEPTAKAAHPRTQSYEDTDDMVVDGKWPKPPTPPNERARLAALKRLAILDTPPTTVFDVLCDVAAQAFSCPMAGVSFVDESRVWLKAAWGLEHNVDAFPRRLSFCGHTLSLATMVVLDTQLDSRFRHHPLARNLGIRFYAGATLRTPQTGLAIGTIFVMDKVPRAACTQEDILLQLAAMAMQCVGDEVQATSKQPQPYPQTADKEEVAVALCNLAAKALGCPMAYLHLFDAGLQQCYVTPPTAPLALQCTEGWLTLPPNTVVAKDSVVGTQYYIVTTIPVTSLSNGATPRGLLCLVDTVPRPHTVNQDVLKHLAVVTATVFATDAMPPIPSMNTSTQLLVTATATRVLSHSWGFEWPSPPVIPLEEARLAELRRFRILDSPREDVFDIVCDIVGDALDCPIAVVSFLDRDRQWLKANRGFGQQVIPRDVSFCAHDAVARGATVVVRDTTRDERFCRNPLVTDLAGIRFYAAAPIRSPTTGLVLGTVFVMDNHPREDSEPIDVLILEKMAHVVMKNLEDRLLEAVGRCP